MDDMILNETPVRTSKNFNINNIKLENVTILDNIGNFDNVYIDNTTTKIIVDDKIDDFSVNYGMSEKFINMLPNKKLRIMTNLKLNKQFNVTFKFDKENLNLVDKIEIVANENTDTTIILKYETNDEQIECFHNLVLKVFAKNNSKLNIIVVNFMNLSSHNFVSIDNELKENADVNYKIVDFGGKTSITNYYSNLVGKLSKNDIKVIYLGKEKQLFDLNYIGELRGEKSTIDIDVQGALKDTSKKHFKGTIDFKKGAKKSKGNENEACMLLSDKAKSISLPMLLCSEEDVEGNHSSSAGKIGKKELFYIMSRGLDEKNAMKLMVRAKFNNIIDSIKDENLREEIIEKIDERLD